jgi:hypothetical protein
MPALGQQRTLGVLPGSGIVRRSEPAPKRRDGARQAAAQAKRERKNWRRRWAWLRCYHCDSTGAGRWPFVVKGVSRG